MDKTKACAKPAPRLAWTITSADSRGVAVPPLQGQPMNHSARQTALHQQPDATLSGEALWVPLCEEAAAFIPSDRVPSLLREWLPSGEGG